MIVTISFHFVMVMGHLKIGTIESEISVNNEAPDKDTQLILFFR